MKKIYLFILIGLGLSLNAQQNEFLKPIKKDVLEYQRTSKISPSVNKTVIYSNTFANPSDWVIAHDATACSLDWQVGTGLACTGSYPITTIVSTTASDGYAMLDSDAYGGATGGTEIEDSWLTMASPVDLNGYPNVVVEFETQYRRYNSENPYIVVGIGDGSGNVVWPDLDPTTDITNMSNVFYAFPDWASQSGVTGNATANPEVVQVNISAALVGLTTTQLADIYIRFNWTGTWGYAWFVDDFKIVEQAANDIQAQSGWIFETNSNGAEYGRTPIAHAGTDYDIGGSVVNFGALDQTNVTLDVNFSGPSTISSTSSIALLENDSSHTFNSSENVNLQVGVYNGTYTFSSDADTADANNVYERNFEITSDLYSLDGLNVHPTNSLDLSSLGSNSWADAADGLVCATLYPMKQNEVINSLRTYITTTSMSNSEVVLYILDSLDMVSGMFGNALFTSDLYTVTANDVSQGYFDIPVVTLTGWDPNTGQNTWANLDVTPGNYYAAVELYSAGNTYDIRILDDETVPQPAWQSVIWYPQDQAYTNGNAFAIQLILGNNVNVTESTLEEVSVYPNPSNGVFNVNTSLNETLNANVFDVAGKLIYTSTLSNSSTIDLSNFGKGTYILELSNSNGSHKETLTVQ